MDKLYHSLVAQWPLLGFSFWLSLTGKLLKITLTLVVAKIIMHSAGVVITRAFSLRSSDTPGKAAKAKTLSSLLRSLSRYAIYFIAGLTILGIFDVPTTSIIASAGIAGLAVGFGAQGLVKDVLTGFFILFEDQYAVGDYIATAGIAGTVEEIGLRVTKLRDFGGELHIVPNGAIERVTNHSRGKMRAMVDVTVAYEEKLDNIMAILGGICADVKKDMSSVLLDGPNVLGITQFNACDMTVRILAYAAPMQQWSVERELRKRIKEAFDREGISSPYPKRIIINQHEKEEA